MRHPGLCSRINRIVVNFYNRIEVYNELRYKDGPILPHL